MGEWNRNIDADEEEARQVLKPVHWRRGKLYGASAADIERAEQALQYIARVRELATELAELKRLYGLCDMGHRDLMSALRRKDLLIGKMSLDLSAAQGDLADRDRRLAGIKRTVGRCLNDQGRPQVYADDDDARTVARLLGEDLFENWIE